MSPGLPAVLIEAFSDRPCAGNGAAVVLLPEPWGDGQLQALATSLRQSETAFLLRAGERWLLRWFTPSTEVPLCGHATLAALLALGHWGQLAPGAELLLRTRSGPLAVRSDPLRPWHGSIDLPSGELQPAEIPPALVALLTRHGLGAPLHFWTSSLGYRVALLEDHAPLQEVGAIATTLAGLDGDLAKGLVLMQGGSGPQETHAAAGPVAGLPVDYRLRFFAPGLGIPEDPVTGSAHALVAPWWRERLQRDRVVGWQCSDRPGGVVCEALRSGMIRLFGAGHLLWNGTLHAQIPRLDDPGAPLGAALPVPSPWPEGWRVLSAMPC